MLGKISASPLLRLSSPVCNIHEKALKALKALKAFYIHMHMSGENRSELRLRVHFQRIKTSAEGFSFFAGCALGARRAKHRRERIRATAKKGNPEGSAPFAPRSQR
jgi:hypothetical protein